MSVLSAFILRRQEDSRQKQLTPKIAKSMAISYERHLTRLGIHPTDYDKVYEQACLIYNEQPNTGPFGIDYILQAALKLKKLAEEFEKPSFVYVKKEKSFCEYCKGTGLTFKEGKIAFTEENTPIKCKYCNG